ncbi:MAG: hypothetical protein R3C68_10260 [Myxococcota bacterium]
MLLNEAQAQAILDMRLARLTGLERDKLSAEGHGLRDDIVRLSAILASDDLLLKVIVEELEAVRDEYADVRRTELVADVRQMSVEDLIADEDVVVTVLCGIRQTQSDGSLQSTKTRWSWQDRRNDSR